MIFLFCSVDWVKELMYIIQIVGVNHKFLGLRYRNDRGGSINFSEKMFTFFPKLSEFNFYFFLFIR